MALLIDALALGLCLTQPTGFGGLAGSALPLPSAIFFASAAATGGVIAACGGVASGFAVSFGAGVPAFAVFGGGAMPADLHVAAMSAANWETGRAAFSRFSLFLQSFFAPIGTTGNAFFCFCLSFLAAPLSRSDILGALGVILSLASARF